LELHCRQNRPGVQEPGLWNSAVAGLQLASYQQLFNKEGRGLGENMWANCGSAVRHLPDFPHGGGAALRYALLRRWLWQILTNPVLRPRIKLAAANQTSSATV
jgi:hypothetical protein